MSCETQQANLDAALAAQAQAQGNLTAAQGTESAAYAAYQANPNGPNYSAWQAAVAFVAQMSSALTSAQLQVQGAAAALQECLLGGQ